MEFCVKSPTDIEAHGSVLLHKATVMTDQLHRGRGAPAEGIARGLHDSSPCMAVVVDKRVGGVRLHLFS